MGMNIVYVQPRHNPEYYYYQVLSDINDNFSAITASMTAITGAYLPLSGGALTGPISGTSLNFSGPIWSASTDLYDIFVASNDALNGGSF